MKRFHFWLRFLAWKDSLVVRKNAFLKRRPHRTFILSRRRDYTRSLKLPGYWSFTASVAKFIWHNRRLFGSLAVLYAVFMIIIGGVTSQGVYEQVSALINQSAGEVYKGVFGSLGTAGLLLISAFLSPGDITAEQQIYIVIAGILMWTTTVWLMRGLMAGEHPRMRDGLYGAGSPLISTLVVAFIAVLQLIPVGVTALVYAGLSAAGILSEGFGMMVFWIFAGLIITLVLYWMTATFLALVVVTLPGMYPMRAIKAAGDLVVGRRLRIMYRLLWSVFVVIIAWVAVMIPVVLLDTGIKNLLPAIKDVAFVPLIVALMSGLTGIWLSAYVYTLYRRIVDDGAAPA